MKLIFIRNPLAPERREIKHLEAGLTVAEHIAPILQLWPGTEFSASINGHLLLQEEWGALVPGDEDSLVLHPVLGSGVSNFFRAIFDIALMSMVGGFLGNMGGNPFWKAVLTGVGSYIGGRIANAILPPPRQDLNTQQQQSNTYGWNGPQPTAQPGTPVAKTYGTVRIAPVLLARFITSDGSNQYLNLLYSGGEGPVDSVDNILIDGNPIGNYGTNIQVDIRYGANDQTVILNFGDVVTDFQLGYELDTAGHWATQTTIGTADQGLQITLEFPYGLAHVNSDGSLGNASVAVEAQYQVAGSGFWWEWNLPNSGTITGAQNSAMWKTFRLDNLAPGQYNVRVRCVSKSGTTVEDMTRVMWVTLSEVIYQDFSYPNRVLVGIKALATSQLSNSDPSVTWEQTRSKVYVWNPNTHKYEQQRASNPYWACYDLIHQAKPLKNINTGQYEYCIDGNPAIRVDYAAFAAAAAYADGLLNGDYRFSLNIYLAENLSFWDALARFAIVGRGTIIPKGTLYSCICDMPSAPVQLFTVGNIAAKSFKGGFQGTRDRASSVEVTFYNRTKDYSIDQAVYYGPGYESAAVIANPVQTTYYGITDYLHAYAEAAYLSRCNQYLVRTENWEADIDAIACTLGDVVSVQHDIPKWGLAGGRIVSATETTVTLDKEVTLLADQDYALKIRLYTDEVIDVPVNGHAEDTTTDILSMVAPFATVPQQYDVYAFGPIGKETKPFKITQIAKSGDQKVKISGIEYVAAVYDEDILAPVVKYSLLNNAAVEVTGLNIGQQTYRQKDGTIISILNISWAVPKSLVAGYNVWYSSDGGVTWSLWVAGTQAANATIMNVNALTTYLVKVCTVSGAGVASVGVISGPVLVTGKILPPDPVQGLSWQEVNGGFLLKWQANAEPDIVGYNVYQGANNATMDGSALIAQTIMTTSLLVPESQAGAYAFHVVAVDTSGNVSPAPATVLASFSVPADVVGFDVVRDGDNLSFMWQLVPGAAVYEIRRLSWEKGQRVGRTTSPYFNCLFPTPGDHAFYIKAVDQYGNYSVNAATARVVIIDSGNRNAVITVDQVADGWPGVTLNAFVDSGNGALQLSDGATRGLHILDVDLGKSFTARNMILSNMVGVDDSGITWGDAGFSWADVEAQAPWLPDGDISGAALDNQISLYTGLPANVIESFPLDGTVAGDKGTPALESVKVSFADGRFKQGAFVGDLTRLSWDVSIPATFNTIFTVSVNHPVVDNVVFLTLQGSAGYLFVGFEPANGDDLGTFYLQDHLGNRVEAALQFRNTDWLSFGIAQTTTTRKLFAYSFSTGAVAEASGAYAPIGSFTAAFLYPKIN
ncbi:MAG: host specificity factor TipJ family phage tail protein [Negativicutes bacterium]|nr:host specificity factor TipJ family phage tail protein [Negativicutes bacterium]